ncbi:hypothetical protein [Tardiphaga sp. 42S5]|uniref:hypothetical protein n=1 Tax=Tardiphaga sp. 42S5 TaxID=1404799 RepID=UPI002A598AF6|nr:hypothetical protein [Tardiphaga sp. 42S5]WPO42028.1 hypothetical protein SFY93_02315 [Tardiphaga sp. 42S5]
MKRAYYAALIAVLCANNALAQSPIQTMESRNPTGTYDENWHYGNVNFRLLSFSSNQKAAQVEWYETLFRKFLFDKKKYGTFSLVLDLCGKDGCTPKPLVRKPIAVFTKNPKQEVKQDIFKDAADFIFGASVDTTEKATAVAESTYINTGAPLLSYKRIASFDTDNVFTVRLALISLDKTLIEKGVFSDLLTIYNSAAANPLIKAGIGAIPGAASAGEIANIAYSMAEKLVMDPNLLTAVTQDNAMQFIFTSSPITYPRYQRFAMSIDGGPPDCKKELRARRNCVIIEVDFSTVRSVTKLYDISKKTFVKPVDPQAIWTNAASAMKVSTMDEYLSASDPLKTFFVDVKAGPYSKQNLAEMCVALKNKLNATFTYWDSKAIWWSFAKQHWFNLVTNANFHQCIGDDADRKEMADMGLEFARIP